MDDLKSYFHSIKLYIKSTLIFRGSLSLFFIGLFVLYFTSFAGIWILLHKFKSISYWTFGQIIFIFSLSLISYGVRNLLFFQFRLVGNMVKNGEIDRHLLKPINTVLSIMGSRLEIGGLVHIFLGIVLLIFFKKEIDISYTFVNSTWLILVIFCGSLVQGGITIIIGTMAFFIVDTRGLDQLYNGFREFIWYPINMYDKFIQAILIFIIPLAFVSFFPAGIFLENEFYGSYPTFVWKILLLVNVIFFIASIRFFYFGLKKYNSTGS